MTDVKAEINEAEPVVEKSAKQLEKEAKKAAKLAKFNDKKTKEAAQKPAAPKEKVEVNF
jgi:valyl-tRNA synthetase